MINELDRETLVKVAKEGVMSRPLVLKDFIAKLTAGLEEPQQSSETTKRTFCDCSLLRVSPLDANRQREDMLQRKVTMSQCDLHILKHFLGF